MKEEIKEILSKDNIHIIECDKNWCNAYGYEKSQLKEDLLDYITNLQEENKIPEKLNEDFNQHCNEYLYKKVEDKVNEIIDYLEHLKSKGE